MGRVRFTAEQIISMLREVEALFGQGLCIEKALSAALRTAKPEIFNMVQGVRFTSPERTGLLEKERIRIRMDSCGRLYNNTFVERMRRTMYEDGYLHEYRTVPEARTHLAAFFRFCNEERPHEESGYRTPATVYTVVPALPEAAC